MGGQGVQFLQVLVDGHGALLPNPVARCGSFYQPPPTTPRSGPVPGRCQTPALAFPITAAGRSGADTEGREPCIGRGTY
ncbi:hypothetical protein GCM10010405_02140 [Streptomyces macrosporus]|uniref:Uncharacterized protein n=1 Tax=Streptomyces macrosporus TaxID=44032 RepID=A0ABP5WC94_9ACTN